MGNPLYMLLRSPRPLLGVNGIIAILSLLLTLDVTLLCLFSALYSTSQGSARSSFLAGLVITSCLASVIGFFLRRARQRKNKRRAEANTQSSRDSEIDAAFLASLSGLPKRFSFQEMEDATKGFSHKLGRGGFGSVYLGYLQDGSEIAVKRLEKGDHGQKEFCAEVATISRVRHANLVQMKGFCVDGRERLLVYEYMPRGSLDRWIFLDAQQISPPFSPDSSSLQAGQCVLSWDIRYRIALETARSLAYLHEECEEAILHLDIKPQNILLDEHFRAKVSDFGLSRCMDRAQGALVTTIRGTPGYLAPEWFTGDGVDVKTDVYSYGMLVLELVSGRRAVDQSQTKHEDWFLPAMAAGKLEEGNAVQVVDPLLQDKVKEICHQEEVLTIIRVGLWCIQEHAHKRPHMSSVVHMLEGRTQVTQPPKPRSFSPLTMSRNKSSSSISIIEDMNLSSAR